MRGVVLTILTVRRQVSLQRSSAMTPATGSRLAAAQASAARADAREARDALALADARGRQDWRDLHQQVRASGGGLHEVGCINNLNGVFHFVYMVRT